MKVVEHALVYGRECQSYNFGPGHPFTPVRGSILTDLLAELDALNNLIEPPCASRTHIRSMHSEAYVSKVEEASNGQAPPDSWRYGLNTGDVPVFKGMHQATLWVVGGTLTAAQILCDGITRRVLHLAGGLHHAHRDFASGFCIYNDVSIAIGHLLESGFERIVYLDIDAHHGDGVQSHFYADPRVLTISLHESGKYLFPGTGFSDEIGIGAGKGYAVNLPLLPYTDHTSYLQIFDRCVPDLIAHFKPDIMVVECGADGHIQDPLSHLNLTSHTFEELYIRILTLADTHTEGRILMHLGGGYNLDMTARVWALLALHVQDLPVPDQLPRTWLDRWELQLGHSLFPRMHDKQLPSRPSKSVQTENLRATMQTLENISRYW